MGEAAARQYVQTRRCCSLPERNTNTGQKGRSTSRGTRNGHLSCVFPSKMPSHRVPSALPVLLSSPCLASSSTTGGIPGRSQPRLLRGASLDQSTPSTASLVASASFERGLRGSRSARRVA